jgi:SAM-dependent methyltransferase
LVAHQTGAEVIGLDLSQIFVDRARSMHHAPNLRFEKADILSGGPCRFGDFDFIFGNGILHHLVLQLEGTLSTLRGITTKNGGTAFIEPNFLNPYCAFIFGTKLGRKYALLEPDEMAFRAGELRAVFLKSGWKNVDLATRDFLLPGLPIGLIKPILAVEPYIEATALTSWLAQSHFVTADAAD